jgi:hypothetical protein
VTIADPQDEFEPGDRFQIGNARAEHLAVEVLSRSQAEDYWDGNWLTCMVRISAGGFRGQFEANLRTEELESFAGQLRTLYDDLKATARLEPMEEQLNLVLQGDGHGHIQCEGRARDVAGTGNLLVFQLYLDQTQLFGTIAQLSELLNRYPVRGSPAS